MFEDLFQNKTTTKTQTQNMFAGLFVPKKTISTKTEEGKELPSLGIISEPIGVKTTTEAIVKEPLAIEAVPKMVKIVQEEIARSGASLALTYQNIARVLTGQKTVDEIDISGQGLENKLLRAIFGDRPLESIERRIASGEITIDRFVKENPAIPEDLKVAMKGQEKVFAPLAIGAIVALDFTGLGGMAKGLKFLTTINKIEDATKALRKMGVAEDLIKEYAPIVVKTTKVDEMAKVIKRLEEIQKTTKVAPRIAPEAPIKPTEALKAEKGIIPQELQPLAQEARKYKSAEEFVEKMYVEPSYDLTPGITRLTKQKTTGLYHGTNPEAIQGILNTGKIETKVTKLDKIGQKSVSVTGSKGVAGSYGNIIFELDPKLKVIEPPVGAVKGDYYKGFEFRHTEDIPISKIKSAFIDIGTKENLESKMIIGWRGREPIYKTIGEVKTQLEAKGIKTYVANFGDKSQLTDFYTQAVKGVKEVKPEVRNLPVVIRGETFILGENGKTISATKKEAQIALKAEQKAIKLEAKQQKIREDAIKNINIQRGNTERITETLKGKNLSEEDIANIVLEDGTKLSDTVKVKRNADKTLSTVIKKSEIEDISKSYTDEVPVQKWGEKSALVEGIEIPLKAARSIELPYIWFERKGLSMLYDPIIKAGKDAQTQLTMFIKRFEDAGLYKKGGWFTANRFNLSRWEAEGIGRYYLSRQGKGYKVALTQLSPKAKKFVEIFDGIIKETEPRFFETAKKMGRTPGIVENYAPIMTRDDIELIDRGGAMDWLFRKHPAFFSLKERVKRVPVSIYETDYRKVANGWLAGITDFLNYGEETNHLKYLVESDQFKSIVKEQDYQYISNWLRAITTPEIPTSMGGQSLNALSRLLRKGVAMGALGLNYASVAKQALTQIPLTIIEKAPPKLHSEYARAFGISVADLPALTKRSGDIAIKDLQGKVGRIFTGALTEFDRLNAQASLNALLDKNWNKFLKEGAEITPEVQRLIEKKAMDALDMWYGGFFKGQRPEAFRKELGNFILMFLYPLTSQLNGFYRHIAISKGFRETAKASAEVLAAATSIAYMEQVIENLSPKWSDEQGMTKDVLLSLAGNIPVVGNVAYSIANETDFQISPSLGNITKVMLNIGKGEGEKVAWTTVETFGLPRQIRRIKEGMEIMEAGGITDDNGKMLAPVQNAMELVRSFLRGKYGSVAAQDWIRNIGEKSENRRWFVPEVEFLQNGDYGRKAELYKQFDRETKKELYDFLSENQQKKLDKELKGEWSW